MVITLAAEPVEGAAARELLAEYAQHLVAVLGAEPVPDPGAVPVERSLVPPRGVFLVARVDGVPAACGGLRLLDETTGEVKRMFVRPGSRGLRLGARLLDELERTAQGLACQRLRLRLTTAGELVAARSLYLRAGFVDVPAYNALPYVTHWMEKPLAAPHSTPEVLP